MWCITLINLQILENPCIPGIKSTWPWYIIFLVWCWIFLLELNLVIYLASFLPFISPGATLCLDFCKVLLINKSYSSWMCPYLKEDTVYTLEPGRTGFKTWFCHLPSSRSKKLIFSKLLFPLSWSWDNHDFYCKPFWKTLNEIKNIKYFTQCLTHSKH